MQVTNSTLPVVSIVLPTFNRAGLIGETIQSVIDQTYKLWELLIVDDGSQDETDRLVRNFKDNRIQYFFTSHTGYIGKTRNFGIGRAKGKYIAFLDSDDLWRNDKLEIQLSLLNKYPNAAFVFSNGQQFGEGAVEPPNCEPLFVGDVFLEQLMYNRFCFYSPSLLFDRVIIDDVGLLDESVPTTRDIHFFYRMSRKFEGIFTNEYLVKIRKHASSTSKEAGDASFLNCLKMVLEFRQQGMITLRQYKKLASEYYYKMALNQYRRGLRKLAFANFLKHNILDPLNLKGWTRLLQVSILPKLDD